MSDLYSDVADLKREVAQLRRMLADSGLTQRRAELAPGAKKVRDADEACEALLGNIRVSSLAGRVPNTYQFIVITPDDCLLLVTPSQCDTGGSSSSSSSSDAPPSSSSSEAPAGCDDCSETPETITASIPTIETTIGGVDKTFGGTLPATHLSENPCTWVYTDAVAEFPQTLVITRSGTDYEARLYDGVGTAGTLVGVWSIGGFSAGDCSLFNTAMYGDGGGPGGEPTVITATSS